MKSPKSSAREKKIYFIETFVLMMEIIPNQPVQLRCACQAKALQFEADQNELTL